MRAGTLLVMLVLVLGCSAKKPQATPFIHDEVTDALIYGCTESHQETLSRSFDVTNNRPDPEELWSATVRSEAARSGQWDFTSSLRNDPKLKPHFIASARETVWAMEEHRPIFLGFFGLIRGVRAEIDDKYGIPTVPLGCEMGATIQAEIQARESVLEWYDSHGMHPQNYMLPKRLKAIPEDLEWEPLSAASSLGRIEALQVQGGGDLQLGAFSMDKRWKYKLTVRAKSNEFIRSFRPPKEWAYHSTSDTIWFRGWIEGALGYYDCVIIQVDPESGTILSSFPWVSKDPEPRSPFFSLESDPHLK